MIHQGVGQVVDHQLRTPLSRTTSCAVSANDLRGADFKAFGITVTSSRPTYVCSSKLRDSCSVNSG